MLKTLDLDPILIISLLVGIVLFVLRRRGAFGHFSILAYSISLIVAAFAYTLLSGAIFQGSILVKAVLSWVSIALAAFVLTYVLEYTSYRKRVLLRVLALLALFPFLVQLVSWIPSLSGLLASPNTTTVLLPGNGVDAWGWLFSVYGLGMLLVAFILLIVPADPSRINLMPNRGRAVIILACALLLAIGMHLVGIFTLIPLPYHDLMLGGFVLIGIVFIYSRSKFGLQDIAHITRDQVLESWDDGILILNQKNQIVDMNSAAEQVIGIAARMAYGRSIEKIMVNWNSLIQNNNARELEFKGSINLNQLWRYFNVRLIPIKDPTGKDVGKTIILRDMTERKGVIDARQRARDELFGLLRSLFSAANNLKTTDEFFKDALYQVMYSFGIQNGAIFLCESSPGTKNLIITASTIHGPLTQQKEFLTHLHGSLDAINWIAEHKQPFIIQDAKKDPRLAEFSQPYKALSLACFPFMYDKQILGIMMLARTQPPNFSSDEITRLNIIAEELASFLYTDQQKQINIALAERKRLTRDLHDSITQKLYGLVTMTEAVQMGLELGEPHNLERSMASISENARQALKEMRLFIHELDPVDIEHEGLVAVLHQRLAAVEGRSDTQGRLIADNDIYLPLEKEVALYYITQEALNNVLKHAKAKSVLVKLKKRKQSVYLEITDDGCGFDPGEPKPGRKGLINMHSRAEEIGAKIKISSSAGKGTKISLSVPK